jgi:hypothetical protein
MKTVEKSEDLCSLNTWDVQILTLLSLNCTFSITVNFICICNTFYTVMEKIGKNLFK